MKTVEEALDYLESLGSAGAIADFFEREGIKGRTACAYECPVANYLSKDGSKYQVYPSDVFWARSGDVSEWVAGLPDHVADFVARFDADDYPTLDAEL